MTPDSIAGIDWNDGNRTKCQQHGVSVEEIDAALLGGAYYIVPDVRHSDEEDRFIATGQTEGGRPLFVVFTYREIDGKTFVRPVSARYMYDKERKTYEQTRAEIEE